jgi:hypothetical protein
MHSFSPLFSGRSVKTALPSPKENDVEVKTGSSDYEALKAYGHSPAKASEIVLDAKRGDFFSRGWIAVVRRAEEDR